MTKTKEKIEDGGYYALKGFAFQFNKSLLEVLENQESDVEIEQIQDIGVDNYYIQVKYHETQTYANWKIKKPMVQLLEYSKSDKSRNFCLYCYFNVIVKKCHFDIVNVKLIMVTVKNSSMTFSKNRMLKSF
jgi:hypothetical protein